MWFFNFIPGTLFYLLFLCAGVGYIVSLFLPHPILKKQAKIASVAALAVSIYLLGMLYVNNWWKAKAAKLEQQVVELEQQSAQTNTVIKNKLITKTEIVRVRGEDIIHYVDREVAKINATCEVPQEFVQVHNRAAEAPK